MRTSTTPTTVQRSNTSPSKKLSDAEIKRIAGLKKGAQNSAQDVAKLVKHIKGHGISQVLLDEIFDNLLVNERKAVIEAVLEKDLMPSKIIDKILLEKDGFLLGILKDKNPDKVIELAAQSQALSEMVQKNQTETKPAPMSPGGKALMELFAQRRPRVIQENRKSCSTHSSIIVAKKAIDEKEYVYMTEILTKEEDSTPVMQYAIQQGDTEAIKHLLWGFFKLEKYKTLLHDLIQINDEVAAYIIKLMPYPLYKTNFEKIVNNVDERGNTPLHIAVKKQNSKMVEELLKIGADIRILNKFKQSALDLAEGDLKEFLQKHIDEKKIEMPVVAWNISSGTPTKLGGYKPIGDESDKHEVIPKPKRLNLGDQYNLQNPDEDDDVFGSLPTSSDEDSEHEQEEAERLRLEQEKLQKEAAAKARAEEEARAEEKHLAEEKEQQRIAEEKAAVEKAEQERIAQEKAELERKEQAAKAERERQEQLKREAEQKTQRNTKEAEEESAYKFRTCMAVGSLFASGSGASLFAAYKYQEVVLAKVSPLLEGHYFNVAKTTLANNKYGSMMISFVSENQQKCMIGSATLFVIGSFVCGYVIANLCSGKSADAGVQK
jgi:hypothetical protein